MMRSNTGIIQTLAAALLAATVPLAAEAFSGKKGTRANPVDGAVFEVIARTAAGANTYWCGAADYAYRALGADWTARIYIVRGRGPSVTTGRKTAVQFTLDPAVAGDAPARTLLRFNALEAGDSLSVQTAYLHCHVQPTRS